MSAGTFLEDYRPATFLERGVAVPFTTPLLAASRVRPAQRVRVEFVITNPSGGMGYYVMGWEGLLTLTKITVHDTLLYDALGREQLITPHTIRAAARQVAVSGAAGRAAAKAAKAAQQREDDDRLVTNFLLIMRLLQQAGLKDIDWRSFNPTDRNLRSRARAQLEKLEPVLHANAETTFGWIEEMSGIVAPVGFPNRDFESRLQATHAAVTRLRRTMSAFANTDATDAGLAASFIADVAGVTVDMADQTFKGCYAELGDLVRLLQTWANSRTRLLEMFGRPDWLLDGWQTISAIWEGATQSGRDAQRAAVLEIQRLVPVMPKEASEWVGSTMAADAAWNQRRWVKANTDWRSGAAMLDRTAQNEALRACAA